MSEGSHAVRPRTPPTASDSANASTARVALPAGEFALADLFERVPDARVECEPTVTNAADHALVVVRTDADRGAVELSLESDRGVAAVEFLTEREDGLAYRVTWRGRPHRLIQRLVAADATILSLRGQNGRWKLRLLAPDRAGISRAHDHMDDLGCGAEYRRISTMDDGHSTDATLTDEQREALVEAFEAGYYDIPRGVTTNEVADELGISHQALSERFRRAYRHLVENELAVGTDYY